MKLHPPSRVFVPGLLSPLTLPLTRWLHRRRGTEYRLLHESVSVQCTLPIQEGQLVSVYVGQDGRLWARPVDEFRDGRFEQMEN